MLDINKTRVKGHVKITDKCTGEILLDKDNAVHFGNFSDSIARALTGDTTGNIKFLKFGNAGTQIDPTGLITYRAPNVSSLLDPSANLYGEQLAATKDVSSTSDPNNNTTVISDSNNTFTDIVVLATLLVNEPTGQPASDDGSGDPQGDFVFDEIGLFDGSDNNGLMLTHILFHPIQKSANREIEIEYTLRIQVS